MAKAERAEASEGIFLMRDRYVANDERERIGSDGRRGDTTRGQEPDLYMFRSRQTSTYAIRNKRLASGGGTRHGVSLRRENKSNDNVMDIRNGCRQEA